MATQSASGPPELRPLGVGEVLDVALKLCVRHWKPLVTIALIVTIPVAVLTLPVILSASPDSGSPTDDELTALGGAFAVLGVVYILLQLVVTASLLKAVTDGYVGGRPSWGSSLSFAFRRTHSLLWIALLGFLIVLVPFFVVGVAIGVLGGLGAVLVLPALILLTWVFVRLLSTLPALLAEDARGTKALRRSWKLTGGHWWHTFGASLVAILFLFFVSLIVGNLLPTAIAAPIGDQTVAAVTSTIFSVVSGAITTPFLAAVIAVIYFDLRVRNEGLDLELLAQRIGTEGEATSPHMVPAGAPVAGMPAPPPPSPGSSAGATPPPPPGVPPPTTPE